MPSQHHYTTQPITYLLHFSAPIAPGKHTAQHYIGTTTNLPTRLQAHNNGSPNAARITQVARSRNIRLKLVRAWYGGRTFERQLKRRKAGPRLCPICGNAIGIYPNELNPDQLADALLPF